jgi:hypothetical protein
MAVGIVVVAVAAMGAAPSAAQTTSTTLPPDTLPPPPIISATLTVTKAVVGVAPPDATFVLHVFCPGIEPNPSAAPSTDGPLRPATPVLWYDEDLTFGATGGSTVLPFPAFIGATCTVTETQNGGAISTSPPVQLAIGAGSYTATITNTFGPSPDTTTTTPAASATAVNASPVLTG